MEIKRIFDILPHYLSSYKPKDDVLASKENGSWVKYNIHQYIEIVDLISYGFLAMGVQKGDRIPDQLKQGRMEFHRHGNSPGRCNSCPHLSYHQ